MNHQVSTHVVYTADLGAVLTILGALTGWLPTLALILPTIWYSILIYDRFFGSSAKENDTNKDK